MCSNVQQQMHNVQDLIKDHVYNHIEKRLIEIFHSRKVLLFHVLYQLNFISPFSLKKIIYMERSS